ncbi:MAG: hypothetical protein JST20_09080 [Bacteroidetes bacterium]|nr:hypothetical protein [Bacteroidota bacterium]
MNNNLQSYFDSVKNVRNKQSLLNNDEIISLVEKNAPTTSLNAPNKSLALLMSVASIITIVGALAVVKYSYSPTTSVITHLKSETNTSNKTNPISDNINTEPIEQNNVTVETPLQPHKQFKSKQLSQNQTSNKLSPVSAQVPTIITRKTTEHKDIEGLKVIELSEDEAFVLAAYYPKLYTWLNKNYSATDTCDITLTPVSTMQDNTISELHSVVFLKIRRENQEQNPKSEEFILWFTPTIEFADALPERYKLPFQKELNVRDQVVTNCVPAERACKTMKGSSPFFDLCRRESGALSSVTISPNPASESAECTFLLQSERDIYISLHEVSGRFVKTMIHNEPKSAGEQKVPLLLQGIPAGAYLVAISTSRGEQAVIQLIIQQ